MNLTEFLGHLSKIKGFKVQTDNSIRRYLKFVECPITAVCYRLTRKRFLPVDYDVAGKTIGLKPSLARRVSDVSDGYSRHDRRLRRRIEKAIRK